MFFLNTFSCSFLFGLVLLPEMGSCYVVRANLKILGSHDPLALGSQISRTISPPVDPKECGPTDVSQSLLCDMFNLFSGLNLFLQVRMTTTFKLEDKVAAFKAKLELWV